MVFVRDRGGQFTTCDFFGVNQTLPTGINDQGTIVGVSFDAKHSGCNPYEHILSLTTVGNLNRIWVAGVGVSSSSPTVANGLVCVGFDDANVYALNAGTGAFLCKYTTGSYVTSSPTVVNGMVYVGSDDFNVYALDARTGALLWKFTTGDDVCSSPAVANGTAYVGSFDKNVYALNAATGTFGWKYTTGGSTESYLAVHHGRSSCFFAGGLTAYSTSPPWTMTCTP